MTFLSDIFDASTRHWLKGLVAAAVVGVGTAFAGLAAGMNVHAIEQMTAIQAVVHIGLYLQKPDREQ
jgi:hypothetical protein